MSRTATDADRPGFPTALADVVIESAAELATLEYAASLALDLIAGCTGAPGQIRSLLTAAASGQAAVRVGLLPGHGLAGEGQGMVARYCPHMAAAVAAAWFLRRESHRLVDKIHRGRTHTG